MGKMKEWGTAIAAIGSFAVIMGTFFGLLLGQFNAMREEVRAGDDSIRAEMRAGFAEMRGAMREEHAELRGAMREEHAEMRGEHAEWRGAMREEHAAMSDRLNSLDRRTARIEGRLFGIEVAPEPPDGE